MTTPAGDSGGDVPAVVVVSVSLICVAAIFGVVFLSVSGREVTPLLSVIGVLSPFIIALLAIRNSRQIARVQRTASASDAKLDGKIDNLIADKANLEHQVSVAGLTPVTATVSFDPESTGPHPIVGSDMPETNPPTNPYHVGELIRRLNEEGHNGR